MHSALNALFHHCAGDFIGRVHIAVEIVIVGTATAAANKFCKTGFALFPRKKTVFGKLTADIFADNSVPDVAH